jgi:hypothetical protein
MRYFVSHKKDGNVTKREEHFIEKCGKCPEQISGFCIRKRMFVDLNSLYDKCSLPVV